ncbi:MAG: branched-chain-amino-acid transaminase [Planctomycetes bacterium]|nr:branched-chain-amino-acid transaminase [Planctomycetota bacterium]
MGLKVYVDGEYYEKDEAKISVFDHGLLYGDGVFEGIRSYSGRVFRMDAHIDRLYNSAKAIMLDIPATPDQMKKIITDTLEINNLSDAYVRLIATRGCGTLGLGPDRCPSPSIICIADFIALYPKELYESGLEVVTASTRRISLGTLYPQVKSLNYLNNILAKTEALNSGCSEAIMLNANGAVAECTGDNIFIVKGGRLITPDVSSGILEGITREAVIELAGKEGIPVEERTVSRYETFTADECFLTGTAAEVISVIKIDQRLIADGKPGPMTKLLHERFNELVRNEGA